MRVYTIEDRNTRYDFLWMLWKLNIANSTQMNAIMFSHSLGGY